MELTRSDYLKAMGIDVWTTRSSVVSPEVPSVEPRIRSAGGQPDKPVQATVKKAEAVAPVPVRVAETTTETPEFTLALFHYESIGICLSMSTEGEPPRRFCDDVARAMGGNVESLRFQLLKWPMLSTSGIDQSINAAREVVTQKFRQMPSRVMVFGDDVGEYYNPLRDLSPMSVGTVGAQTFLMVPSLKELLGSGSAKRELLQAIHHWRNSETP